jgi:hypothetical protein
MTDETEEYVAAVRAALADVPDLLEDLDEHLAEVAAESDRPLTERLGPPEAYAAELRAAYGAEVRKRRGRSPRAAAAVLHRRLSAHPLYQPVADFLPELRPAWWVARGVVPGLIVARYAHDLTGLAVGLVLTWISVWWGRRVRARQPGSAARTLIGLANAVAAVLAIMAVAMVARAPQSTGKSDFVEPEPYANASVGDGVSNIYPYSSDGRPLTGVRLYDQNGKPIEVPYEDNGMRLDQPCGGPPPITNAYPLPLRQDDPLYTCSPSSPSPSHPATPSPRPTPSARTATPSPRTAAPRPSDTQSTFPSPPGG